MFNNMPSLNRSKSFQAFAKGNKRTAESALTTTSFTGTSQFPQRMSAATLPQLPDLITKRLTRTQLDSVRQGDLFECSRLRFFMEYPESVRFKLLDIAQPVTKEKNVVLFK